MIVFYLDMPGKASWNGKWSGEGKIFAKVRTDSSVPSEYIGQSFNYRWDDGWEACVTVEKVTSKEANKIRKQSAGFCGYEWMIDSIIDHGYIITPNDFIEQNGDEEQKFILNIVQKFGTSHNNKDYTRIDDFYINRKELLYLVEENIIDPSEEICSGGPTIQDIINFLTKYDNEQFYLIAIAEHKKIIFKEIAKNTFDKVYNCESAEELDKLLKHCSKVELQYDNKTKCYKFDV